MKKQDLQLNIGEKEGIVTYCLCLFASLVLSFFVINMPESNAKTLLSYALTQIAYLLVPIIFLRLRKVDYLAVVPVKNKVNPIGLLLVVPITIGAFLQNTILAVLLNRLFNLIGLNPTVTLPAIDTPLNAILAVLTVVILAPVAEEGLYRGVVLSSHKSLGVWKSALISALIFALSHFNLAQLAHQFVLGFLLAIMVLLTDNIWYAVAMHVLNNLIALFIGDLIPAYNSLINLNATNVLILVAMCVVGALILIPSFAIFNKICAKDNLKINGNPFRVFSKKHAPEYHTAETNNISYYTIGFLAFLVVMSVFSAISPLIVENLA